MLGKARVPATYRLFHLNNLTEKSAEYHHLHTDWRYLIAANEQTPIFAYPEWLEAAWQQGILTHAAVLVIYRDNRPIALFPLCPRSPGTWQTADFFTLDCVQWLIDPAIEEVVWQDFADWLRRKPGIGRLNLGVCSCEPPLTHCRQAMTQAGFSAEAQPIKPSFHIPLLTSWDTFLSSLGKSTRAKLRKIEAHMHDAYPDSAVDLIDQEEATPQAVCELIRLYCGRWGGQIGGSVLCNLRNANFYHAAVRWAVQQNYGIVPIMRLGTRVIAAGTVYHIPGQQIAHFHFIARDPEALPNHWLNSPGLVLICHVIRWAMARGATSLNMGSGNDAYKIHLSGQAVSRWQLIISRSPLVGSLLGCVDRLYYLGGRLPVHLRHHLRLRQPQLCPPAPQDG